MAGPGWRLVGPGFDFSCSHRQCAVAYHELPGRQITLGVGNHGGTVHLIMIRLLDGLEVIRPDGSVVEPREWRTGKTADLLRLLALHNGRPVGQSGLIEKLWPDVTHERARASLRTACSQVRRAMRADCVVRQPGALVLEGAWVDVEQFHRDVREATAAARSRDLDSALTFARIAERHYRQGFHAYDDQSAWAIAERNRLERLRHEMLCDAAAAALHLGRPREAADFAATAVGIDGGSESAHRALMQAQADLGEIGGALRTFEAFRARLADELGADPSEQTRELHLRLLRGEVS